MKKMLFVMNPYSGMRKAAKVLTELITIFNRADYEVLLRVPGIGVRSARRILTARRVGPLSFEGLKRLGVVLKRAQYFLTCSGRMLSGLRVKEDGLLRHLVSLEAPGLAAPMPEQLSLFDPAG